MSLRDVTVWAGTIAQVQAFIEIAEWKREGGEGS